MSKNLSVSRKPAVKEKEDTYYECVFINVYDFFAILENLHGLRKELSKEPYNCMLKGIGEPERCLDSEIDKSTVQKRQHSIC